MLLFFFLPRTGIDSAGQNVSNSFRRDFRNTYVEAAYLTFFSFFPLPSGLYVSAAVAGGYECGVQFTCRAATPVGEKHHCGMSTHPLQSGVVRIDGRNGKKALALCLFPPESKESKQALALGGGGGCPYSYM